MAAARRLTGVRVAIAYAANAEFPDCSWLDAEVPVVLQEGADLGERLTRAFRWAFRRKAQRVVVIGSDAPGLSARWLAQAFRALERADVVLGPTTDGGYHLIGLNEANPALFAGMPWSTSRLLAKTLGRIGQLHASVHCLRPIADLDTPDDVRRYAAGLDGRRARTHTDQYLKTLVGRFRAGCAHAPHPATRPPMPSGRSGATRSPARAVALGENANCPS